MKVFIIAIATLLTAGCATGPSQVGKDNARDQSEWTKEDTEALIANSVMTERFECRGLAEKEDAPVQVVAEVRVFLEEDGDTVVFGVIVAAGQENYAVYEVEGFLRRWDFGGEGSNEYAFTIDIDNTGRYLDFTDVEVGESVNPTKAFKCTLASTKADYLAI